MNLWQISTIVLYALGAVLMLRLIYVADLDMTYKSNGYEKIIAFVFWPVISFGCIVVLSSQWLKDRK